jgi:3-hydroxyacyl-CoA dehydrogenase/enoyl-CoA hydratase/3-hydroxybutyryl-CoA epimerase/enoyl-CoA isomerase
MIFQGTGLSVELVESGIAELRFDQPGSPVNTLGTQALGEFAAALAAITLQKDLRGLLITSAKGVFIAGADIMEFLTLFAQPEAELAQTLKNPYAIFNTLEDLPIPTLVAINGAALGGGFELCLACDFRIMASAPPHRLRQRGGMDRERQRK